MNISGVFFLEYYTCEHILYMQLRTFFSPALVLVYTPLHLLITL